MRALVTASVKLTRGADGGYYSKNPSLPYSFWCRYLSSFDTVNLIVRSAPGDSTGMVRVDGPNVLVSPVSISTVRSAFDSFAIGWRSRRDGGEVAVFLRLPCLIGSAMGLARIRRGWAVELVGDPSYASSLPKGLRAVLSLVTAWLCRKAVGVAYVTRSLAVNYPSANSALVNAYYSSIDLDDDIIAKGPKVYAEEPCELRLITVGSLDTRDKGVDVLLEAIVFEERLSLTVIGGGYEKEALCRRAETLGVAHRVRWLGQVFSREVLFGYLDISDIFVLASRTEGLPKAMIEAMARGLPVVGTAVGGIPELVSDLLLARPGDSASLSRVFQLLLDDSAILEQESRRSIVAVGSFARSQLAPRRDDFYRAVALRFDR